MDYEEEALIKLKIKIKRFYGRFKFAEMRISYDIY